jgi:hypothetical protein
VYVPAARFLKVMRFWIASDNDRCACPKQTVRLQYGRTRADIAEQLFN